ncbi:hypothetical protein D3C84_780020 [compost metagenome]
MGVGVGDEVVQRHTEQRGKGERDHEGPLLGPTRNLLQATGSALVLQGLVDRGVTQFAADVHGHTGHDDRGYERYAPAPGHEVCIREGRGDDRGDGRTTQECRTSGASDDAGCSCPAVGGSTFNDVDAGAGPLTADHHALQKTQRNQQDRRSDADARVAGQQTDQGGGQAHAEHGDDQHSAASQFVADRPQHHGAQGP